MVEEKLDVKIGSEKERLWTNVMDQAQSAIKAAENEIEINKALVSVARKKIAEEKR